MDARVLVSTEYKTSIILFNNQARKRVWSYKSQFDLNVIPTQLFYYVAVLKRCSARVSFPLA